MPAMIGRAVGSLLMLVVLVALVAGVPWLLVVVGGWPLPTGWPDWSQVWLDLRQLNIDQRWVIGVLAGGAWLLWGQIIWSLLFEAINMVRVGRGLAARPAPFTLPVVSMLVSKLVAGALSLTLLTSSSASAASAASAGLSPADLAPAATADDLVDGVGIPDEDVWPGDSGPVDAEVDSPEASVVVGPTETAWDVAARVFGDGERVDELLRLNDVSALDVGPGTVLRLPPGVAAPGEASPVTVAEGDHFWELARNKLTDSWGRAPTDEELTPYWAEMLALNDDRLLPPGDPDLIYPGQELLYPPVPEVSGVDSAPAPPPDGETAGPLAKASPPSTAQAPTPRTAESTTPPVSVPSTPVSTPSVPSTPSTSVSGSSSPAAVPSEPGESTADGDHTDHRDVPIGLVAVSGIGLVTAAVGGIITRNKARRIGGRRPGTAPRFQISESAERLITETADGDSLADLDRALRHLGATLTAEDLAMPYLVGVLVGESDIRLLLATPHKTPPAPFTVERDGMVWSIDRPVLTPDSHGALNPYPTLTSVGYTDSARLLLDIEYVGSVNLTGGFADVVDAMGTMALQLATSPLADTIDVVCVGFGEELAEFERISVVPTTDGIASVVREHAAAAARLTAATSNTGPAGRAQGVGDWTPLIVFDPLTELAGDSAELLGLVEKSPSAGVSAVLNSVDGAALTMELSDDRIVIPSYGVDLSRRPLTRGERTDLSSAVAAAKTPVDAVQPDLLSTIGAPTVDNGGGPSTSSMSSMSSTPSEGDDRYDYIVRLLGPLRVDDRQGESVQFARSATPEFLAYLVHHRNGVDVEHVMSTLWPSTTARRTWIANVYADAARSLETADSGGGVALTPRPGADDEYRLAGAVTSDVEQFRALVTAAIDLPVEDAVELLTDALALVEGIPYTNITSRWPITEGHWQDATILVDEAARCVAVLALDQFDDPVLADWATARGLLASPHSVELHRLRLRSAIALDGKGPDGGGLSPDAVFQHYQAVVMADDHRPEAVSQLDPELVDLYESYRRSRPKADTLERQH